MTPNRPTTTPPHNGSDTSREAAASVAPYFESRKNRIEAYLRTVDGDTRDGIALALSIDIPSVCSAVDALLREGRLHRGAMERRLTRSGRKAQVLRAHVTLGQAPLFRIGSAL